MDAKLFEILGRYAGLAGFSIGLILLVFRAVLKSESLPRLNTRQVYSLLRLLILLTFSTGIVGIGLWAYLRIAAVTTARPAKTAPSAQSGPATTEGQNSPAITGDGNKVVYGQSEPSKSPPPRKE
jgi:hypothetical protein